MMDLLLVRHGESEWNQQNLFTGWTDVALTDRGRAEADLAGELLVQEGFDFDLCYTSYLKRAIDTLDFILKAMDRQWLPVVKDWRLNERHYGALQGLNKAETAKQYGEEQVLLWRRSFDVPPPPLAEDDPRNPQKQVQYRDVDPSLLPLCESLKDTIHRVMPYFTGVIRPQMEAGKRVLIVAHGNSIRAMMQVFEQLTPEEILTVNIPTGVPLLYTFDDAFQTVNHRYLGDPDAIARKMQTVANQGKVNAPKAP